MWEAKQQIFPRDMTCVCSVYKAWGLNPPLHTQHNEGVGSWNEGNPNAAIRRLGTGRN